MTARRRRYQVAFTLHANRAQVMLGPVFDMLRYDGAIVENWEHGTVDDRGRQHWTLTLTSEHPAPERWNSMGIVYTELPS